MKKDGLKNLRQTSQTDRGEEIDGKSGVFRAIPWEQPFKIGLQRLIIEPLDQLAQAHILGQFLQHKNCEYLPTEITQ